MEHLESVKLDSDEDGWELVVETDTAVYRFNAHALASGGELEQQLRKVIADMDEWLAEGRRAAGEHERELNLRALREEDELAVDAMADAVDQFRKQAKEGGA